jgi:hypothetical protein
VSKESDRMTRLTEADLQAIEARAENVQRKLNRNWYFHNQHGNIYADLSWQVEDLALLIAEVRLLKEVNRKAKRGFGEN